MAIDGMKVIDLDSHLVGDLESWDQTVEDNWRARTSTNTLAP